MAAPPNRKAESNADSVSGRSQQGLVHGQKAPPWKPGQSGNPGGRPKQPEWLAGKAEAALLHIAAVAAGEEPAPPELRLKAATVLVERYYGKAKERVEIDETVREIRAVEVRIVRAEPQIVDVPTRKQLDAE